jgi:hypothetical protein
MDFIEGRHSGCQSRSSRCGERHGWRTRKSQGTRSRKSEFALACQSFRALGPHPSILNIAETASSGPSDGHEDGSAKEEHLQSKLPNETSPVSRNQDDCGPHENKTCQDNQSSLGCGAGGIFPNYARNVPHSVPCLETQHCAVAHQHLGASRLFFGFCTRIWKNVRFTRVWQFCPIWQPQSPSLWECGNPRPLRVSKLRGQAKPL